MRKSSRFRPVTFTPREFWTPVSRTTNSALVRRTKSEDSGDWPPSRHADIKKIVNTGLLIKILRARVQQHGMAGAVCRLPQFYRVWCISLSDGRGVTATVWLWEGY